MSRPRYGGTSTLELSLSLSRALSLTVLPLLPCCNLFLALYLRYSMNSQLGQAVGLAGV